MIVHSVGANRITGSMTTGGMILDLLPFRKTPRDSAGSTASTHGRPTSRPAPSMTQEPVFRLICAGVREDFVGAKRPHGMSGQPAQRDNNGISVTARGRSTVRRGIVQGYQGGFEQKTADPPGFENGQRIDEEELSRSVLQSV